MEIIMSFAVARIDSTYMAPQIFLLLLQQQLQRQQVLLLLLSLGQLVFLPGGSAQAAGLMKYTDELSSINSQTTHL
jgi:hypothetical protein